MSENVGGKLLNDLTAELVKSKMELSYERIKQLYEIKNLEIEKMEDKINKLSDRTVELKLDREQLEDELNGLYESYVCYCRETGLKPAFEI